MSEQKEPNSSGTTGFVFGICSLFTCGLLWPFGIFFSFLGLFKAPRAFAVAGMFLSSIGFLIFLLAASFSLQAYEAYEEINTSFNTEKTNEAQKETVADFFANRDKPHTIRLEKKYTFYTIQKGDNYWKIANRLYGDGSRANEIQKANPNINPNAIQPGWQIAVPKH